MSKQQILKLAAAKSGKGNMTALPGAGGHGLQGEILTKDVRMAQMGYMKAAHFQVGYERQNINMSDSLEREAIEQKWNPEMRDQSNGKLMRRSNWAVG